MGYNHACPALRFDPQLGDSSEEREGTSPGPFTGEMRFLSMAWAWHHRNCIRFVDRLDS